MRTLVLALLVSLAPVAGCGGNRALNAVQDGVVHVDSSRAQVIEAAGMPELILATRRVEAFFYRRGDRAVSVTVVAGRVVAFSDDTAWPEGPARAADDASSPVSTGRIAVGMSEREVRDLLGEPDGITAKSGTEALHWLTGDDVDSMVFVEGGKVVGFWDRPIDEFTQNVPTSDRDAATTNGRLRVGMSVAQVESVLGKPDGVAAREGLETHKYESDPVFGDEILYLVGYRDGKVVDLAELNVSREEAKKENEEAKARAAEGQARAEEAEGLLSSLLGSAVVRAALGAAVTQAAGGGGGTISSSSSQSSATKTLDLNGTTFTGSGADFGRSCSTSSPCPSGYVCHMIANDVGSCVQ